MLLLNIGPKADGSITEEETAVLEEIGAWMAVNGEGIYGTVPWKQFGEGGVNNSEGFFQDNEELQPSEVYHQENIYLLQKQRRRILHLKELQHQLIFFLQIHQKNLLHPGR